MRRIAAAVCLALALAACDGGKDGTRTPSPGASPSPPSVSPTPSPTPSPSGEPAISPTPSPTPTPSLQLPKDAPTELEEPLEPEGIATAGHAPLLPPGATPTAVEDSDAPEQIAVAWFRGDDPFARENGLVVWQRFASGAPWRAVYGFTDRPSKGVLVVRLEAGDLTDDGLEDLLSREELGGTGACATWRVIVSGNGSATEAYRLDACDTTLEIADGALSMREAVYEPDDPHCCPSAFRYVTLEWDGETFVRTSSELVENPS